MKKKVLRSVIAFFASIACIFTVTVLSCLIPHELIHDNTIASTKQLEETFKNNRHHFIINRFEEHGDMRNYAMLFATDPSNPIKSAIEMNYNSKCYLIRDCGKSLEEGKGTISNYNRYWHGQSVTLHFLTIFFNVNTLIIISTIIFAGLFIYTIYKLFKKDKPLAIIFVLSSIAINLPFTTRSIQYIPIMYIMLISVILTLRMYEKKSEHFEILFLLLGVFTCFFDFLTAETLSVTTPLFIYAYLKLKENKKVSMKKIIVYALIWLAGYAGTFLMKWALVYLDQGIAGLNEVISNIFSHGINLGFFDVVMRSIGNNFSLLLPFCFTNEGTFFALFILGFCIIYTLTMNRKYLPLLAICLIPILRFTVVKEHSFYLCYFTYRALFCVVMFMLLTIYKMIHKAIAK